MNKFLIYMVVSLAMFISLGFQTPPDSELKLAITQNVDASYTFEQSRICLYTVDDGSTDCLNELGAYYPKWISEGQTILFLKDWQLYQFDRNSGTSSQVTDGSLYTVDYGVSPDGAYVITQRGGTGSNYELQIIQLADLQTRVLYSGIIDDEQWLLTQPVFSPDGNRVAVVSKLLDSTLNPTMTRVDLLDITDGQLHTLTATQANVNDMQRVVWSPDGQQLLYATEQYDSSGYRYILFLADIRTDNIRQLAESTRFISYDWSANGQQIIFNTTVDNTQKVFLADSLTLETQVISEGGYYRQIRWAPDGIHIAFLQAQGESLWRICTASVATTLEDVTCLPVGLYVQNEFDWQPIHRN